jgi:type IV pilus assembly protein PilA
LMVVAIIGIIAAIAIPGLMRARMAGNEASAIASLRAIYSAQSAFSASCGGGGYATALENLATLVNGTRFISPDLGVNGVIKSGYAVNVGVGGDPTVVLPAAQTCNTVADSVATYYAEAHPPVVGSTGSRSFGTDIRGTIFQDLTGGVFDAASVTASTTHIQ